MAVFTAENGNLALDAVCRAVPDVVVTDVDMPVMDVLNLCRQLWLPEVFPIAQLLSCVQRILAYMTKIFLSLRRMTRLSAIVPLAAIVLNASAASAQLLGSAQNFAVLGASTVTNTGATDIKGDVGVSPGTAITGFLLTNTLVG